MSIYYVRTTGDDTTGDGSSALPWLTISKAQATVASGDTVRIGAGTYDEDTAAAGFFNINRSFTSWVTFESETHTAADVVIRGASHATYNTLTNAANAYYRFRKVTFGSRLSTNVAAIRLTQTSRLEFVACAFVAPSDPAATRYAFQALTSGATTIANLTLLSCTASVGANTNAWGMTFEALTGSLTGLVLTNCTASGSVVGANFNGTVTTFLIDGGTFSSTGNYGLRIGNDSQTVSGTQTGAIVNATISTASGTGHALLLGAGSLVIVVDGCTIRGADYGIVLKESAGHTIRNTSAEGGFVSAITGSAVYVKGATGCTVEDSEVTTRHGTRATVRLGVGDTGNKSGTFTLRNTRINAYGVDAVEWADSTGDSGGGVVDRNTYDVRDGGTYGDVRGTLNIATLAGLRSAWSGYGDGSNDAMSTVASQESPMDLIQPYEDLTPSAGGVFLPQRDYVVSGRWHFLGIVRCHDGLLVEALVLVNADGTVMKQVQLNDTGDGFVFTAV